MVLSRRECKPLQCSCLENTMNSMKMQKVMKDELPRSAGAQDATGEEWRNSYRKNEERDHTHTHIQKHPVVDVTGDGSKV